MVFGQLLDHLLNRLVVRTVPGTRQGNFAVLSDDIAGRNARDGGRALLAQRRPIRPASSPNEMGYSESEKPVTPGKVRRQPEIVSGYPPDPDAAAFLTAFLTFAKPSETGTDARMRLVSASSN